MDWVRNGFVLPLQVGLFLVPQLGLLYFFARGPGQAVPLLVLLVVLPLLVASGAGAALGNCHPSSRRASTIPPFIAARPVTSAEILAVKFRVAVRATLVTWAMVGLAMLAVLPFCVGGELLAHWTRQ